MGCDEGAAEGCGEGAAVGCGEGAAVGSGEPLSPEHQTPAQLSTQFPSLRAQKPSVEGTTAFPGVHHVSKLKLPGHPQVER